MANPARTPITGVCTIGIPVTDQDRALAFYVGVLGLEKQLDVPLPQLGGRWIVVAPTRAATSLALIPSNAQTPAGIPTGIRLATADAAALHAELVDQGVRVAHLTWSALQPLRSSA